MSDELKTWIGDRKFGHLARMSSEVSSGPRGRFLTINDIPACAVGAKNPWWKSFGIRLAGNSCACCHDTRNMPSSAQNHCYQSIRGLWLQGEIFGLKEDPCINDSCYWKNSIAPFHQLILAHSMVYTGGAGDFMCPCYLVFHNSTCFHP